MPRVTDEHSDSECVDVLRRVHLIKDGSASTSSTTSRNSLATQQPATTLSAINEDVISLSTQVSAGGANFSHGQRQLFALSRALLRRSKIVILDEATSALDFASDAAVQDVIRTQFGDALLLTGQHISFFYQANY
jgi:ABC-type multidrug transport system fused ATPase/permease subunit